MRRARTTTKTGVLCARYMCPRTVEAPGACARGSGVEKSLTVPGAALQRRPAAPGAGAGGSAGACAMRAPAASPMEGTAPLLRRPPGPAVPDGPPPACRGCPDVSLAVGPQLPGFCICSLTQLGEEFHFRLRTGQSFFRSPQIAGAEFIRRWPVFDECVMEDL